jgi:DNA modification methylase
MNERFTKISDGCYQARGDVFAFLDDLHNESIDIVITDPPYGIGELNLPHANARAYKEGEHYEQMNALDVGDFIKKVFHKMKENSAIFVMTNRAHRSQLEKDLEDAGFTLKNELVWVKVQSFAEGMALGNHYLNAVEYILYAHKGKMPKVNEKMNVFVKPSPNRGRNSKPEELYAHILVPWLKKIDNPVIIDPFGGSDPLSRARMRGLIHSCTTISNIMITGDETDPANHGRLLKAQNLGAWL